MIEADASADGCLRAFLSARASVWPARACIGERLVVNARVLQVLEDGRWSFTPRKEM